MNPPSDDRPPAGEPRHTKGPGTPGPLLKAEAWVHKLERTMAIYCPSNLAFGAPDHPIIRSKHHVFVRPFGKAFQTGNPQGIGRVRFGLLRIAPNSFLRAPYSLAYVTPHPGGRRHSLLPGRLHLFLGDKEARYAPLVEGGGSMRCDHITIEPTRDQKEGLSAHLRDASRFEDEESVQFSQTPLPLPADETVDLGTLVVSRPDILQEAGTAIFPPTDSYQARRTILTEAVEASLEPWHPMHTLPEAIRWEDGHHLSISFVLSPHAHLDRHYPHHQLVHESVIEGFDDDPTEPVRFQAVPLNGRFLIVILKVSQGRPKNELLWSMKRRTP